jgi:hypothetical protein
MEEIAVLAIAVLRGLIKEAPELKDDITALLTKNDPVHEDYERIRAHTATLTPFKLPVDLTPVPAPTAPPVV